MRPTYVSTRRAVVAGGAVGLTGVFAAACGPADGGGSGTAANPAAAPIKLRFLSPAAHIEESVKQMVPVWEAKNPTISIEWIHSDDFSRDVIAHSAANDMEDLVSGWMGGQEPQIWFLAGITIPLDGHVKTQRVNSKDWYKAVWESHFLDGKQFSLPWQGQVFGLGLMYNKRVFDEVGQKYPDENWTLNDFVAAAEKLRIVNGNEVKRWGVAPGEDGFVGERFPGYARNFNAEMFSADQKRITWGDTPDFLNCLNWHTDVMQRRHGVMYSIGGARRAGFADAGDPAIQGLKKYTDGLLAGKLAMVSRVWLGATGIMAAYLRDNPGVSYGMTLGPKGPTGRRGGWMTSAASSITRFSKNPDAAFKFLIDFTGRDWSVSRGLQRTGSTTLNGRPDVYHDTRLQQDPYTPKEVALMKAKTMDATESENCSYNGGLPWNFRARDIWEQQRPTIDKIPRGEAPGSQDMITEFRRLTEPILRQERTTLQQLQK